MVSVQRAEVNLRAGAGTQHEARWVLSRGYPLEVTGRKGQWLHVRDFENATGWIFRPLVGKQANHVVKGNVVNLRSGPSTSYGKVQLVDRGTKVKAAAKEGNWTFVSVGSKFGWISSDYLSTKPPAEVTSGSLSRT